MPTIVVVQPRRTTPMPPSGWFSRAFAATGGYLVASALASVVGIIAMFMFSYYLIGEATWTAPAAVRKAVRENRTLPATAAAQSRKKLKELGIVRLAEESSANQVDGKVYFSGRGKDTQGKLHSFLMVYDVVTFGNTTEWHLETVMIDDELAETR